MSLLKFWVLIFPCAWAAVVFRMHYTELLSKDEEIAKLQAVIQALSGK